MKNKETLEEAAEHNYPSGDDWTNEQAVIRRLAFKNGAKWMEERMYSEEDMIAIVEKSRETGLTAEYLLLTEQFKKK